MKKFLFMLITLALLTSVLLPNKVYAEASRIDEIMSSMSNEDKIAMMIMPAFRKQSGVEINEDNIKEILSTYGFAGVILFAENTTDTESTMRFVDLLQDSNKNNPSRLLIAIDQEGGYVTRLGIGTNMPGNMALAATNDPKNAYDSARIIGSELSALGINTDFAPVVDVNNNPSNPVIGIRSFSDDPNTVATYSEQFMKGLQSEGIATSLKHFPGHGDTNTDTHTGLAIIEKSYDELKKNELIPFQKLVNGGTDMIMTAHIQFPNIEKETYVSKKDGQTYTLPATLSKTILTDILRKDMGYEGVIVTDAMNMAAISTQFGMLDASIKAINAGADILLMPFTYDSQKDELKEYIQTLASKIGTEISEENVNNSVRRILTLKEKKGLLAEYDNSDLENKIEDAKKSVSSVDNHSKEFEIAKKSITMIKNDDKVLPLSTKHKTVILYEYGSHVKAVSNAISLLKDEDDEVNGDNIVVYPFYDNTGLPLETIKEVVSDAKNVVMIRSTYGLGDLADPDLIKMNQLIDYVHENGGKVIAMSTQLPYDIVKFKNADALVLTYLANGIRFDLEDYEDSIPKYGPNVMAGIYMLFTQKDNMTGVLPVNIYGVDNDNKIISEVLYKRGFGLRYLEDADLKELKELLVQAKKCLVSNYTEETLSVLEKVYNNVNSYLDNNSELYEEKQSEIDSYVLELKEAIDNLIEFKEYEVLDGANQEVNIAYNEGLSFRFSIEYDNFKESGKVYVDNELVDSSNYTSKEGSTIVTFNNDYTKTLSASEHSLKVEVADGEVTTNFTIKDETLSPKTGDSLITYIMIGIIGIVSLIGIRVFNRKLFN